MKASCCYCYPFCRNEKSAIVKKNTSLLKQGKKNDNKPGIQHKQKDTSKKLFLK